MKAERLERLAAVLRKVVDRLQQDGDARAADRCRALQERLAAGWVQVVVMGEFKRGKSTLINALIGRAVLPMDVVPLTSVVTIVRRAQRESATVVYLDGHTEEAPLEKIAEFVTEKANPGNSKKVDRVEVGLPSAFLLDGVHLVDTPGVGSIYRHNTETAQKYLPQADAVILVLAADPPISQSEVDFLHAVRRWARKLYVVLNKTDYLSEVDLARVIDFTGKTVRESLGSSQCPIHALSARSALELRSASQLPSCNGSGIEGLMAALEQMAIKERRSILFESVQHAVVDILTAIILEWELEANAHSASIGQLDAKVAHLKRSLDVVARKQYEAEKLFAAELKDHVASMEDALYAYARSEAGRIRNSLEGIYDGLKGRPSAEVRKELNCSLMKAVEDSYSEYLVKEESSWAAVFQALTGRYLESTLALVNQSLRDAAETFGVPPRMLEKPIIDVAPPAVWFVLEEVSPWSYGFLPLPTLRMFKPFFWKALKGKTWEAMDVNAGRIRYDYSKRIEEAPTITETVPVMTS